MKIMKRLFILGLLLLIAVPLIKTDFTKDVVSKIDNTKLTDLDLPKGVDPVNVDSFLQDKLGFRERLLAFNGDLNNVLFHRLEHVLYTYGKNGEVFFTAKEEEINRPFLDEFAKYLRRVQDYCNARGVPFLYCVNPSKATIMREYLPSGYTYEDETLAYLVERLKYYQVNFVDNTDVLKKASQSERVFEHKYDVGHWNDLGAMYGTNTILYEIMKVYPSVELLKKEDFTIKNTRINHMSLSRILINEDIEQFSRTDVPKTDLTEEYKGLNVNPSYSMHRIWKLDNETSLPRVLFFHGSYYNRNTDIYSSSFKETYAVHNYENFLNFDYYFNIFKPDYVVMESAEYTTNYNFFDFNVMKNRTLNQPLKVLLRSRKPDTARLNDLMALKDRGVKITEEPGSRLLTLEFSNTGGYTIGYLNDGTTEYDLQVYSDKISMTLNKDRLNKDTAVIYLFR